MNTAIVIGICSFSSSFLGCFQIINLAQGHRIRAIVTSCAIALCQLMVYKAAQDVHNCLEVFVYVAAGLAGSQLAMYYRKKNDS